MISSFGVKDEAMVLTVGYVKTESQVDEPRPSGEETGWQVRSMKEKM